MTGYFLQQRFYKKKKKNSDIFDKSNVYLFLLILDFFFFVIFCYTLHTSTVLNSQFTIARCLHRTPGARCRWSHAIDFIPPYIYSKRRLCNSSPGLSISVSHAVGSLACTRKSNGTQRAEWFIFLPSAGEMRASRRRIPFFSFLAFALFLFPRLSLFLFLPFRERVSVLTKSRGTTRGSP